MFKTLLKKQFTELFQMYFINKKTGKARSSKSSVCFIILFVFILLSLAFSFFALAGGVGAGILGKGVDWVYFSLLCLLSVLLGTFGSVFNTYSALYLPKDNEFLLSLPIPVYKLLSVRITEVYIMSLIYTSVMWIPSVVAYFISPLVAERSFAFPVLLTLIIPFFVTVLSCILGFFVALISSKTKNKSFVTIIISLGFIGGYYFFYFKATDFLNNIQTHTDELQNAVKSYLHFSYVLGKGAAGDVKSFVITVVATVALFALCVLVLSKTYLKFTFSNYKTSSKSKKKEDFSVRSIKKSLLLREFKHISSEPMWLLNGGLGVVILLCAAVAAIIKADFIKETLVSLKSQFPDIINALPVFIAVAVCVIVSMNTLLSVCVSIEGKQLWILKSLPVDYGEVLSAKKKTGIIINVPPAVLTVTVLGIVFGLSLPEILLSVVFVLIYTLFVQNAELFLSLKMPRFEWVNVTYLVKQSMPVTINLFGGWALCAVLGVGGYFLSRTLGSWLILTAYSVIIGTAYFFCYEYIRKNGVKIFKNL